MRRHWASPTDRRTRVPELPEVETTCRGIRPHLLNKTLREVRVHQPQLRWLIPDHIQLLTQAPLSKIERRAKYLLIGNSKGQAIVHLGMSGSLRVVNDGSERRKHDHVELETSDGTVLRYHDPRRFGCWLWQHAHEPEHKLLTRLGPEPFDPVFSAERLHQRSRKKQTSTKQFIMDNAVVVGVGNIYASEALFRAGLRPGVAAGRLSKAACARLHDCITEVLREAIAQGGTTLKDFVNSDGQPGYFAQSLAVYGRGGEPCISCDSTIQKIVLGQRSSYYCPHCQS